MTGAVSPLVPLWLDIASLAGGARVLLDWHNDRAPMEERAAQAAKVRAEADRVLARIRDGAATILEEMNGSTAESKRWAHDLGIAASELGRTAHLLANSNFGGAAFPEFLAICEHLEEADRYLDNLRRFDGRDIFATPPKGEKSDAPEPDHADKTAKRRKRRKKQTPLTATQAETMQVVTECNGSITAAAGRMNKDPKTVRQAYAAAMAKLPGAAIKPARNAMPQDRRGQDAVAAEDDKRRG